MTLYMLRYRALRNSSVRSALDSLESTILLGGTETEMVAHSCYVGLVWCGQSLANMTLSL